jgi:phospholipid/cholesterol/gamma-HCH transport system permease protein
MSSLFHIDPQTSEMVCCGNWTVSTIGSLENRLQKIDWSQFKTLTIKGNEIEKLDSAGGWVLQKLIAQLNAQNIKVELTDFSERHEKLLSLISKQGQDLKKFPRAKKRSWFYRVGERSVAMTLEIIQFLGFIGELTITALGIFWRSIQIRWRPFLATLETMGFQALPIVGLLSFMIGVVLAYQMGLQLKNYGANIFIVDLLGVSVLREFGPMLTAIIVAGRTGSAFTAQIGTMKLNEEIDALRTMGITPDELLILPKIMGLLIALPLLTMWADIFGVIGGMVMSQNMLDITWGDFLTRFQSQVTVSSLLIGMGKAPVFALIIGSIGCYQGMKVSGGADSVGKQTTKSVVQAIFFILVTDALFSVIFSKFNL